MDSRSNRGSLSYSSHQASKSVTINDKLRKDFKKPKGMKKDFMTKKEDTVIPDDSDEELIETRRKTREAQELLQKKKRWDSEKIGGEQKIDASYVETELISKADAEPSSVWKSRRIKGTNI